MSGTPEVLTAKEEAFCQRIAAGDNGTTAAKAAGYSAKRAAATASELLRKRKITEHISVLKSAIGRAARAGVVMPGAGDVVLTRQYLLQRLIEIQHGYRDAVALRALELVGAEEFKMFAARMVITDPAAQSTDDLQKLRDKIRRKHGLAG